MNATYISRNYDQEDSVVVHGRKDYNEKIKQGYKKVKGGNGSYRMCKPSTARITFEVNNVRHIESVKDVVLNYCGGKRVTEKKFNKFCDAWQEGKINVCYSEYRGLFF